jgi:hypothetical protein
MPEICSDDQNRIHISLIWRGLRIDDFCESSGESAATAEITPGKPARDA